jgi:DNA-directed RNA polymerase subunit M/transcription elongation factor TFIIS
MKTISVMDKEIQTKFNVKPIYYVMECNVCKNRWGVNVEFTDGEFDPSKLICRKCAIEEKVRKLI